MLLTALSLLLMELTAGLLYPSESDRPFTVKKLAKNAVSMQDIRIEFSISDQKPLESTDLNAFFGKWADPQPWHDAGYKAVQQRMTSLRSVLQSRQNVQVYRAPGVETDWIIVVPDSSGVTVLHTQSVAT